MIETFQLITLVVCCGYVSNLIGHRTINIPEIILGVHGLMGFTVNYVSQKYWQIALKEYLVITCVFRLFCYSKGDGHVGVD